MRLQYGAPVFKVMDGKAVRIVNRLLENDLIRACANCDAERHATYPAGARVSHGICRRHYVETLTRNMGLSLEQAEQIARASEERNPNFWCPEWRDTAA